MMRTVNTKRKNPKVIKVNGSVKRMISGLMKILRMANTSEKIKAVSKDTIETWGASNFDKPNTATAMMSILMIHFMVVIFWKVDFFLIDT